MEHLNNASSQTKNYEITFFHSRVTEGSYHSSLFSTFLRGLKKAAINIIYSWNVFIYFLIVNLGSKKDLRVSGVELRRCSCKAFFSFPIKVLFLKLTVNKEKGGGTSTLGERSTTKSCMLRSGRMNRS